MAINVEVDVLQKDSYLSGVEYNKALSFARATAKKCKDNIEFSRKMVVFAMRGYDDYYKMAIDKGYPEDRAKVLAETLAKDQKPARNYCFLHCLKRIKSGFSEFCKVGGNYIYMKDKSKYNEYLANAYITFTEMLDKSFDISKVDDSVSKHNDDNYDYFNAIAGRLTLELKNTNRYIFSDENSNGINFDGAKSKKGERNLKKSIKYTSFDEPGQSSTDDDGYSRADKLTMDYMNNNGISNEISLDDDENYSEFLEKWQKCCKDPIWNEGLERKNGINRKAKALKFVLLDVLGNLGIGSGSTLAKAIYSDKNNPLVSLNYDIIGTQEGGLGISEILSYYKIDQRELLSACQDLGVDKVLGYLKGKGSALPDNETVTKVANFGKEYSKSHRDILRESKIYYPIFKDAIEELIATIDWSETDGSDIKEYLNSTLPGGIKAHRDLWKKYLNSIDIPINKFQKEFLKDILSDGE